MSSRLIVAAWILAAGSAAALAAPADCRECHSGTGLPGEGRDLSAYYLEALRHHPTGIAYPAAGPYRQPDARDADGSFFDRNRNGSADADEVRLFGAGGGTVECASCHHEHGDGGPAVGSGPPYLRGDLAASALCVVCHRY